MSYTAIASMSVKELKAYVADHGITVTGDKRKRASYIEAIEAQEHDDNLAHEMGRAEGLIPPTMDECHTVADVFGWDYCELQYAPTPYPAENGIEATLVAKDRGAEFCYICDAPKSVEAALAELDDYAEAVTGIRYIDADIDEPFTPPAKAPSYRPRKSTWKVPGNTYASYFHYVSAIANYKVKHNSRLARQLR